MAVPPQSSFQFQHIAHPATTNSYHDSPMKVSSTPMDSSLASSSAGSKKQKTTPPCDRCRQRRVSLMSKRIVGCRFGDRRFHFCRILLPEARLYLFPRKRGEGEDGERDGEARQNRSGISVSSTAEEFKWKRCPCAWKQRLCICAHTYTRLRPLPHPCKT